MRKLRLGKKKTCFRCGTEYYRVDKYCRNCGLKRGEINYDPYYDEPVTVYGPPTITRYECKKCHRTFSNKALGRITVNYCPICGNDNSSLEVKKRSYTSGL